MQPKGVLLKDGEQATLAFHRIYRHTPQHIWEALTTPDGLREWAMCSQVVIQGRAGGRIEMVSGPGQYRSTGKILAWDPPRVLEYEWNVAPVPEMPYGERAVFRYELTPEGDSTRLLVTYRRISSQTAPGFLPGTHALLDRLEAQLDGRALPDWMQLMRELHPHYPDWSGRAPDSAK
jgi:uncharacterized protein YndB with AHSA1/START domain